MKKTTILIVGALMALSSFAEIKMPRIFSDSMLLQRDEPVKFWGTSDASAEVKIEFAGQSKSVKADEKGKWVLYLDSLKANKSPAVLTVYENGKEAKKINDVLVGEVWMTGGQSNMQWFVKSVTNNAAVDAVSKKDHPNMRYFSQPIQIKSFKKQSDLHADSKWVYVDQQNIPDMGVIGLMFGAEISEKLGDVPVGIISSAIGGTPMVIWCDTDLMKDCPAFADIMKKTEEKAANWDYEKAMQEWSDKVKKLPKGDSNERRTLAQTKPMTDGPSMQGGTPGCAFNAKIHPLAGYTAKGFLWYQGESDQRPIGIKDNPNSMLDFIQKFECTINSWRKAWGKPDMPFYFVYLASFDRPPEASWAYIREAQMIVKNKLKNVEGATLADSGAKGNIHPNDKEVPSNRLARYALKNVYGIDVITDGPVVKKFDFEGNELELNLKSNDKNKPVLKGELRGFEVLVSNAWVPAKGEFDGDEIKFKADGKIDGVRYLWKNYTQEDACIFNSEGLPMMPFRKYNK